jgi:hypothetical protein
MTLVRVEIILCVWKSHSCVLKSHLSVLKSHSCLLKRVLAKIYLKIDTYACDFHTQTCHFHTQFNTVYIEPETPHLKTNQLNSGTIYWNILAECFVLPAATIQTLLYSHHCLNWVDSCFSFENFVFFKNILSKTLLANTWQTKSLRECQFSPNSLLS